MALSSSSFFIDEAFQNRLCKLLLEDRKALNECAVLLTADDFKPRAGMHHGRGRWMVAGRALAYYQRHHEPISSLIRSEILAQATRTGLSEKQVAEAEEFIKHLGSVSIKAPDAIIEKVVQFKQEVRQAEALEELNMLQSSGQLTEAKWWEQTHKVFHKNGHAPVVEYFDALEVRTERREWSRFAPQIPLFLIDPLDDIVRGIGPGELGLLLAPTTRGKSLMLKAIALAYALQRLNVLFFTLEDPLKEVEDQMDAAITKVPIHKLKDYPKLMAYRFARYRRLIRSRLRIVDGTSSGLSIAEMAQIALRERDNGFAPHAIIIDYDDEVVPATKHKDRRFEFADIYRDMRMLAGNQHVIVWTAAQTQRDTEGLKILSGDRVAEDISKIRKSTMVIGMGKGDWGPESIYLWVAKHKFDRRQVGCHIVSDLERMVIYDPDKTRSMAAQYAEPEDGEEQF